MQSLNSVNSLRQLSFFKLSVLLTIHFAYAEDCNEHLGMADEYLSKRCDVCDVAIEELFGINNSNFVYY